MAHQVVHSCKNSHLTCLSSPVDRSDRCTVSGSACWFHCVHVTWS